MILFPWTSCTIDSPLPPDECRHRLAAVTRAEPAFTLFALPKAPADGTLFRGRVDHDGFAVSRVIRYRNSFLPVVRGRLRPGGSGTRVAVTMRLHLAVAVCIAGWLAVVGTFAAQAWFQWLSTGRYDASVPIMTGMFLAGYLMTVIAFGVEARRARAALTELFGDGAPTTSR